ncbi:restriction endonuclease subunit S [Psychrobacter okhotskensis]|uniref:restriction endonuclease subunit S n=1 Tax=Psychrobacter okhotskensis TaxID=212403 RepID=UPI0019186938|nr:restriction endonuclease subunit S [Psychrobacter okhotskensis]
MRLNYKKIGKYIRKIDIRNKDGSVTKLLGVNLDKKLMPSVANIHGVDLTKYKLLSKNQFACKFMSVGRDEKLPIGFYQSEEKAIVSSAYFVFETIDENVLNSEYLMMWISRLENDRLLWFKSGGDVRGSISWDDFCDVKIPVVSIEKQHEIVREYNVIKNRIKLNNQLMLKLENTIQAIYKLWFLDFDFPISAEYAESIDKPELEGQPYKTSNGKMANYETIEYEIPHGWVVSSILALADIEDGDRGKNYPKKEDIQMNGYCLFLGAENISYNGFNFQNNVFIDKDKDQKLGGGKLQRKDIVMTTRGSAIGKLGFFSNLVPFDNIRINSGMLIFRSKDKYSSSYIYTTFKSSDFQQRLQGYLSGSAQPQLPIKDIKRIQFVIPDGITLQRFYELETVFQKSIDIRMLQNISLENTAQLLLSKMSQSQ